MPFEGSYLWRLRQKVGSDLVLVPGAMVFLVRDDGAVLFTRRADDGRWCLPAGGAEEGSSFAATAVAELREETGVVVDPADLEAFACLSEAELHTITYPGGDVSHCFAMLFLGRRWSGEPRPDGVETTEMLWADPAAPPSPLHEPSSHGLDLYRAYLREGTFRFAERRVVAGKGWSLAKRWRPGKGPVRLVHGPGWLWPWPRRPGMRRVEDL